MEPYSELTSTGEIQDFIHGYDGQWYFWDETSTYRYGPYPTKDHAQKSLWFYCRDVILVDI
jgi:hypothetical protein